MSTIIYKFLKIFRNITYVLIDIAVKYTYKQSNEITNL